MSTVMTIAKRELRSYFDSPVAYIVIVAFLLISGFMFFSSFFLAGRADMRPFFTSSLFSPSILLTIIIPAITMRSVAEEVRSGSIELLSTLPITDAQIIMGKFFAAFGLVAAAIVVTGFYPFSVSMVGELDVGPVLSGYLGFFLFVAALVAIGIASSAIAKDQIVSFIIAMSLSLSLYLVKWLQFVMPKGTAAFFEYVSVSFHLDNLARGVIDTRDVLYYLTLTAMGLVVAIVLLRRRHA